MQRLLLLFLFIQLSAVIRAQDFSGTYTGVYSGDPVTLSLSAGGQNAYTGVMNDSHWTYDVAARATGKNLKGTCAEKSQGITMEFTGLLNGATLSLTLTLMGATIAVELKKSGTTTTVAAGPKNIPADAQHDPALVGRWTHQSNYNSGYGQGSMSSENVMIFYADGRLADGGSKTVTGGADWSGSSSAEGTGVVEGVVWYTKQQQIFLHATANGKTETQLLGRYYIENNKMLITGQDGTKVLFYKG